jgi:hypothetical protein
MLKKMLIAVTAIALLATTAQAVPPPPQGIDGFIAQCEIPVCIIIDKYAEIMVDCECLLLHEKPGEWWEGSCIVTIINNWSVRVAATIEPYLPSIVDAYNFDVMLEGDPLGFNGDTWSEVLLHPYPDGYALRLWAGIQSPNLLARASSPYEQRVATIYLTVQN